MVQDSLQLANELVRGGGFDDIGVGAGPQRAVWSARELRAEKTMIGTQLQRRNWVITSTPSMSGRPQSRMIAAGGDSVARGNAARPSEAVSTV
jgi:hypothetical protein